MAEIDMYAWAPDPCRDCVRVGLRDGWRCAAENHTGYVQYQTRGYAVIVVEIPYVHVWEMII